MATSKQRERDVEAHLVKMAKKHGGHAHKFTAPGRRSVPDRICDIPCWTPHTQYVECKAEGKEPTDNQLRDHKKRRKAGAVVHVVDTKEQVDALFASCLVH